MQIFKSRIPINVAWYQIFLNIVVLKSIHSLEPCGFELKIFNTSNEFMNIFRLLFILLFCYIVSDPTDPSIGHPSEPQRVVLY